MPPMLWQTFAADKRHELEVLLYFLVDSGVESMASQPVGSIERVQPVAGG